MNMRNAMLIHFTLVCLITGCNSWKRDPVSTLLAVIKDPYRNGPDDYGLAKEDVELAGLANVAAPRILELLDDHDSGVRERSAQTLAEIGADSSLILPKLLDKRRDPDVGVRRAILLALGAARPTNDAVIEALLEATADPDMRVTAIGAFWSIGPKAKKAVPILIEALDNPRTKLAAAEALGNIGPDAANALPRLRKLATEGDDFDRIQVVRALRKIEGDTDFVISALIDLLKCDYSYSRREAARTLGEIGPPAKRAIPALLEILAHPPQKSTSSSLSPPAVSKTPKFPFTPSNGTTGVVGLMTEEEAYPNLRAAVLEALSKIRR